MSLIVLLDMDNVLFDWSQGLYRLADRLAEHAGCPNPLPPTAEWTDYDILQLTDGTERSRGLVLDALNDPRLYPSLQPLPGAVEAVNALTQVAEVFVCSTPSYTNPRCAQAKHDTLLEHFGPGWAKRLILTHDKTLVHGHVLVDDKPRIRGQHRPSWTQVVFDQPYNRDVPGPRMTDWGRSDLIAYLNSPAT